MRDEARNQAAADRSDPEIGAHSCDAKLNRRHSTLKWIMPVILKK
jgi:hypothetical protein